MLRGWRQIRGMFASHAMLQMKECSYLPPPYVAYKTPSGHYLFTLKKCAAPKVDDPLWQVSAKNMASRANRKPRTQRREPAPTQHQPQGERTTTHECTKRRRGKNQVINSPAEPRQQVLRRLSRRLPRSELTTPSHVFSMTKFGPPWPDELGGFRRRPTQCG